MKKKSTSKNTFSQQFNQTTTPTNPEWVTSGMEGLAGQITGLSDADPYSFVAGPDPLQTQAADSATRLGKPYGFSAAEAAYGEVLRNPIQAASLLDNLDAYMSPYTQDVVDASLADFDYGAGQQEAQAKLDLAGDATFGGSGGAIGLASLREGLNRGRGTLSAGLRDQAFTRGAALSSEDAARRQAADIATMQGRLAAGQGMAGVGAATAENERANIGLQADLGSMLQELAQRRAVAPLSLLGTQATLFSGLPLGLLRGETSSGTSSGESTSKTTVSDPMGSIGGLLQGAGSLASGLGAMGLAFSDRRLKTDIEKVGKLDDGTKVYRYRYKDGGPPHLGVMAQEVRKSKPDAVHNIGGLLAVDYGKL